MPLTRLANGKLIYFSHAPKCAGTAVERYLQNRFGPLGLLDPAFGRRNPVDAWSLSPPQHMPEAVRRELLPDTLFDAHFATVRHPATRLRSVFLFQREVEKSLPLTLRFERWLDTLPRTLALDVYALHGHLRPITDYVPETARVFRVEDGLDAVVDWLDAEAGGADGPRQISAANVLATRLGEAMPAMPPLTSSICAQIATLYPSDYERFSYDIEPPAYKETS